MVFDLTGHSAPGVRVACPPYDHPRSLRSWRCHPSVCGRTV